MRFLIPLLLCALLGGFSEAQTSAPAGWMPFKAGYRVKPFANLPTPEFDYVDGATVSIEFGYVPKFDKLYFDYLGKFPIVGNFDPDVGVLFLSGQATVSEYVNALTTVVFSTLSEDSNPRRITWSFGANTLYFSLTGHYYRFFEKMGVSWQDSKSRCSSSKFFQVPGYLATVTSKDEMSELSAKANFSLWLGGSDNAAEGVWRWVTGPEGQVNNGQGELFWTGMSMYNGGVAPPNTYTAWNRFQPDNGLGEAENFLSLVNTADPTVSYWADMTDTSNVGGFVCEYGGNVNASIAQQLASYAGSVNLYFGCELFTNSGECTNRGVDGCGWTAGLCVKQSCESHLNEDDCVTDWHCDWNVDGEIGVCTDTRCSGYSGKDACAADPQCTVVMDGTTAQCHVARCSDRTSSCQCAVLDGCVWRNNVCEAESGIGCSGMDIIYLLDASSTMSNQFGRYQQGFFGLTQSLLGTQFFLTGTPAGVTQRASNFGMRVGFVQFGTGSPVVSPPGTGSQGRLSGLASEVIDDLEWHETHFFPTPGDRYVELALKKARLMLGADTGRNRIIVIMTSGNLTDAQSLFDTMTSGELAVLRRNNIQVVGVALKSVDPDTTDSLAAMASLQLISDGFSASSNSTIAVTMDQLKSLVYYGLCTTGTALATAVGASQAAQSLLCESYPTETLCEKNNMCSWDSASQLCINSGCLALCSDTTCSANPSCSRVNGSCVQLCQLLNETQCGETSGVGACRWDYNFYVDHCVNMPCVGNPTEDGCIADTNGCLYNQSNALPCQPQPCQTDSADTCVQTLTGCAWNGNECYQVVCNKPTQAACLASVTCEWNNGVCSQNYCGQYLDERDCQHDYQCQWDISNTPAACGPAPCTYFNTDPATAQANCQAMSTKCTWSPADQNPFNKDMCVAKTCDKMLTSCDCSTLPDCVWRENQCKDNRFVQCPGLDVVFLVEGTPAMLNQFGRHPQGYTGIIEAIRTWSAQAPLSSQSSLPGFRLGIVSYGGDRKALFVPPDVGSGGNLTGDANEWFSGVENNLDWMLDNIQAYATSFSTVAIKPALEQAINIFSSPSAQSVTPRTRMVIILGHSAITDGGSAIERNIVTLEQMGVQIFSNVIRRFSYITPQETKAAEYLRPFASDPHTIHFLFTTIDNMKSTLLDKFCDPSTGTGQALGISRDGELPCSFLVGKMECEMQTSCKWDNTTIPTCPTANGCPNLDCEPLPEALRTQFSCEHCELISGAFQCSRKNQYFARPGACVRDSCMMKCQDQCNGPACAANSVAMRCERNMCAPQTTLASCNALEGCVWKMDVLNQGTPASCVASQCAKLRTPAKCQGLSIPSGNGENYSPCKMRFDITPVAICEEARCPNLDQATCSVAPSSAACKYVATSSARRCQDRTCTYTTSEQCRTDNTCYWNPYDFSCNPRTRSCVLSGYSEWSPCTSTCGPSSAVKTRAIIQFPSPDGTGASCQQVAAISGCDSGTVRNCNPDSGKDTTLTVVESCSNPPSVWIPSNPGVPTTTSAWPANCSTYCEGKSGNRLECIADNSCQWQAETCTTKQFLGCLSLDQAACSASDMCSYDTTYMVCRDSMTVCPFLSAATCNSVSNCAWRSGSTALSYARGTNLNVQLFNPGQIPIFPFAENVAPSADDIINGATVVIELNYQRGKDVLNLEYGKNIRSQWFEQSGTLRLYGQGSVSDYGSAIKFVSFTTTSTATAWRRLTWSFGNNTVYSATSRHHYRFQQMAGVSYEYAKSWCSARMLYGLQGYLATVTSADENDLLSNKLLGYGWLSGTDKQNGIWRFDSGPAAEAGTQFWSGGSLSMGGYPIGNAYSNWAPPNDTNINGEPVINIGPGGSTGNDRVYLARNGYWESRSFDTLQVDGFICEFGGAGGVAPAYDIGGAALVGIGGCVASTCVWHGSQTACQADIACQWSNGVCQPGCGSRSTETDCQKVSYCRWDTTVQPAACDVNVCSQLGVAACAANPKCEWDPVNNCVYREGCGQFGLQADCINQPTCMWIGQGVTAYCTRKTCNMYPTFGGCKTNPWCRWDNSMNACTDAKCIAGTQAQCEQDSTCMWNDADAVSVGFQPGGATIKPFSYGVSPPNDISSNVAGVTIMISEGFQKGLDTLFVDPADDIAQNYVVTFDPDKGVMVLTVSVGTQINALQAFQFMQRAVQFSSDSTSPVRRRISYVLALNTVYSSFSNRFLQWRQVQATSFVGASNLCKRSTLFGMTGSLAIIDNELDNMLLASLRAQGWISASSNADSLWSWIRSNGSTVPFWDGVGAAGVPLRVNPNAVDNNGSIYVPSLFAQWGSGEPALPNSYGFLLASGFWKAIQVGAPIGVICDYTPKPTTPNVNGIRNVVPQGCFRTACLGLPVAQCSADPGCVWKDGSCGRETFCPMGTNPAQCNRLETCYWDYSFGSCKSVSPNVCNLQPIRANCVMEPKCAWNPQILRRNGLMGMGGCIFRGCAVHPTDSACRADPVCQWLPGVGPCVARLCGYLDSVSCWRDSLCIWNVPINGTGQCTPSPCTGITSQTECLAIDSCKFNTTKNECYYSRCSSTGGKALCQNDTACLYLNGECTRPDCNFATAKACRDAPYCYFSESRKECLTSQCSIETTLATCEQGITVTSRKPCIWDTTGTTAVCRQPTYSEQHSSPPSTGVCELEYPRYKIWWLWVCLAIILGLIGAVIYRVILSRRKGMNFLEPTRKNYKYNPHQMYAKDLFEDAQQVAQETNLINDY